MFFVSNDIACISLISFVNSVDLFVIVVRAIIHPHIRFCDSLPLWRLFSVLWSRFRSVSTFRFGRDFWYRSLNTYSSYSAVVTTSRAVYLVLLLPTNVLLHFLLENLFDFPSCLYSFGLYFVSFGFDPPIEPLNQTDSLFSAYIHSKLRESIMFNLDSLLRSSSVSFCYLFSNLSHMNFIWILSLSLSFNPTFILSIFSFYLSFIDFFCIGPVRPD